MQVSVLDFRRKMRVILQALERNEVISVFVRGKQKGILYPITADTIGSTKESPAFGMWKDQRDGCLSVHDTMRGLRKNRYR